MRSGRCAFAIGAALFVVGASARAQTVDFSLRYVAPTGCPAESTFEEGVLGRAPHARRVASSDRGVEVLISGPGAGSEAFRGEVTLVHAGAQSMQRSVTGSSCGDVLAALEFIVAMSVEGMPLEEPAEAAPEPTPTPPVPPTTPVVTPVPSTIRTPVKQSSAVLDVPPRARRVRWRSSLVVSGGVTTDLATHPGPLVGLAYEGRFERGSSVLSPGIRLELTYASATAPVGGGETLVVRAGALAFDGCPLRWELFEGTLAVTPCGTIEGGGRVAEVSPVHAGLAPFPALGIGGKLILGLRLSRLFLVELGGAALAPLLSRRLLVGNGEPAVFSTPSVGLRGALGLGVSFP